MWSRIPRHAKPKIPRDRRRLCSSSSRSSARWQCSHCRRTFTDYPSFACPYKAYTLPQMAARAARYITDVMISYRTAVRSARLPICYQQSPPGRRAHCCGDLAVSLTAVAHTSLFRWVTSLANKILPRPSALSAGLAPAAQIQIRRSPVHSRCLPRRLRKPAIHSATGGGTWLNHFVFMGNRHAYHLRWQHAVHLPLIERCAAPCPGYRSTLSRFRPRCRAAIALNQMILLLVEKARERLHRIRNSGSAARG